MPFYRISEFISRLEDAGMTAELMEEFYDDNYRMKRWIETIPSKAVTTFTILVDYVQPEYKDLKSIFADVDKDYAKATFTNSDLCKDVSREKREVTFEYVTIDCEILYSNLLVEIDRHGLRPALYEELLAFVGANPNTSRVQLEALGSFTTVNGLIRTPYIFGSYKKRHLCLNYTNYKSLNALIIDPCRSLFVRK